MSDSDTNFIFNNNNNNDSIICALKIHLEDDEKLNPGDRYSYMIGVAMSFADNFTEASLKEPPFTFDERIKHKPKKNFLAQEMHRQDKTKKNIHPKSISILLEIMKNEVLLDDSEVTRAEEHLENIKIGLGQKSQIDAEV